MNRLIDLLKSEQSLLCDALAADYGQRSSDNTRLFDVLPPVSALKYAKKNLRSWMKPQKRKSVFPYNVTGGRSYVKSVPLGVVGNISPWNFPVTLSLSPLGNLLAAGNRVILKPSEFTPETSTQLQLLIDKYFDQDEIAVVTGGAEIASAVANLPLDHLLFTGSTAVGRKVAQAAAPNLVPTTLELGGKSPVIVSNSAKLENVAQKLLFAKTMNAGQICLAPDYVLIHKDRVEALLEQLTTQANALFPNGVDSPDYVNIINDRHVARFQSYITEARELGHRVVNLFSQHESNDPRRLGPQAVVINTQVSESDYGQIMQEEIFGPLLPIVAIDDFTDAVKFVSLRSCPLALYYFGENQAEIDVLENEIRSGGMVINDLLLHFLQDDLPFGGVGDSGMGKYHGREGFEQFSNQKSVFVSPKWDVAKMIRPPYGKTIRKYLKLELGE